jgi:hypothetical protein
MINQTFLNRFFSILLSVSASLFYHQTYAQMKGCTDRLASNYNSGATINDGTCTYSPATVNVVSSVSLPAQMKGTSGLIWMNNKLWTQNNFSDINLYSFLPDQVSNFQTTSLTGTTNIDWEEMTQDENYMYIGDFGNNVNGNRTNLQILRIRKHSLLQGISNVDTIRFSYNTQTNFSPTGANKTNYDCEAFFATKDSLYLFTKEWLTNKTSIYRLPKTSGNYSAVLVTSFDVQGLITGAVLLESKRLLVLSGYNNTLQPFLYLLYDYPGYRFFDGNKRKLNLNLPFHQVEAITTQDGINYHITNEALTQSFVNVPQQLHELNISPYISSYLSTTPTYDFLYSNKIKIYPVPANSNINVELPDDRTVLPYKIINSQGALVQQGIWNKWQGNIDVSSLHGGTYWIVLTAGKTYIRQWVKQ